MHFILFYPLPLKVDGYYSLSEDDEDSSSDENNCMDLATSDIAERLFDNC